MNNPTYIYIVGRGHSGSTMLELLLNRSQNIAAMGEIDQLSLQIYRDHRTRWTGLCSCGERPFNCEIWGQIIKRVYETFGFDMVADPFGWKLSDIALEQEYWWRRPQSVIKYRSHRAIRMANQYLNVPLPGFFPYQRWVEHRDFIARSYAELAGAEAVVDASKDVFQMGDLAQYSSLPLKVLFLTRDARGLAWSSARQGRGSPSVEAKRWAIENDRIGKLVRKLPSEIWTQVRYEDITHDVEAELDRIHQFIGIERKALPPEEERAKRHTIAGNRTRLRALDEIREDQAWRDHLTPEQVDEVTRIAGDVARKLGYDI